MTNGEILDKFQVKYERKTILTGWDAKRAFDLINSRWKEPSDEPPYAAGYFHEPDARILAFDNTSGDFFIEYLPTTGDASRWCFGDIEII